MASLKEVKGRINSINGTLKITSAMKMVASAKLHKAQEAIENMLPYERRLHKILTDFTVSASAAISTPYMEKRPLRKVALLVFASNSSLCGGYNANVIRHMQEIITEYTDKIGRENLEVYPIGRKVAEAVKKLGFTPMGDFQHMSGKPNYHDAAQLAEVLMKRFREGEIQHVELLYNHFKSTSTQILTRETYLPISSINVGEDEARVMKHNSGSLSGDVQLGKNENQGVQPGEFIIEPSAEVLMRAIVPKVLCIKLYTVLLDSAAAEHAARTMAMQIASDNATDLIQELTLTYNKTRQQAITNELLDIVGGTMA